MRLTAIILSLSAVATMSTGVANAATNLVVNGNFESTTNGTNKQLANATTTETNRTTLTGWTSDNGNDGGYNFVLDANTAKTNASAIWLKNPVTDDNNGYTASANGGNIFASDALYYPGTLSQTVTGLTKDATYALTFDYALAQQVGFNGANTDNFWQVGLGNKTYSSSALSIASGGFSGWQTATMYFTAGGTTELLSFLAKTSSPGAPPFLLLDGVSVTAVPEPTTWGMMLGGIGLVGFLARRRQGAKAA